MKKQAIVFILVFVVAANLFVILTACSKPVSPGPVPGVDTTGGDKTPVDPPIANTVGFFLNDWAPRNFTVPAFEEAVKPSLPASVFVTIDAADVITKIPRTIFGQNANIWMSQIVTEPVLLNHLKKLQPPLMRFPGGSLSDVYFWNATPGSKPANDVPEVLLDQAGNAADVGYWYGKNSQSWTLSVDNFYNLKQQTNSEAMITINYGYARYGLSVDPVAKAAHLAADWVRYDKGRTKYWEIGNESNGTWEAGYRINTATNKDGQPEIITGALYGKHFRVFADSMRKAAQEIGKTIYIGAYLLEKEPEGWQTATDKSWNEGVLKESKDAADFYIIHSYYTPYQQNSSAEIILNTASDVTRDMMLYVKNNISKFGASPKPVALTEWNITSQGSMQQVSFVNGMHATILLGEAIRNKYGEASRWDLANGWSSGNDHGLFNIGDEPGSSKWNPRPTFYYMYYFQKMLGDRMLNTSVTGSVLSYASLFSSGEKAVVLINKASNTQTVVVDMKNAKPGARYYWYLLTGGTDNGEFSRKVVVNGKTSAEASGGPAADYDTIKPYSATTAGGIKISMPARSVAYLVIDK